MSNVVTIQFTRFTNIDEKGKEINTNFGYRIYDSYESQYNNTFSSLEELNDTVNRDTLRNIAIKHYGTEALSDVCSGVDFNGEFIELSDL